jgi:hypothetical protein
MAGLVKLAVRLEADPAGVTQYAWAEEETLWAQPLGHDLFEVRNIPWVTARLHFLDVVRGRLRTEDIWDVLELVRPSGHTTLRLTFATAASGDQRDEVIRQLEQIVGNAEHMDGDHWAVDVNPGSNIVVALALLVTQEKAGIIVQSAHA